MIVHYYRRKGEAELIKVIEVGWLFWADGMSIFPWIFVSRKSWGTFTPGDQARLLEHEYAHWIRQRIEKIAFYWRYLREWLKFGYYHMPEEENAREQAKKPMAPHFWIEVT